VINLAMLLDEIRGNHHYATEEDVRKAFGDYHNLLRWLSSFLLGDEKLADACIVDACTIAETQAPEFHEWLVHWAARATVRLSLQTQYVDVAELAPKYENGDASHVNHPPLSPGQLISLIKNSDKIRPRLDALCRFVLVLRGIAKDTYEDIATQLGISRSAAELAYCVAFESLEVDSVASHCL
jgi:DNA-directed RNA polymerase specialized sigma24 family protein